MTTVDLMKDMSTLNQTNATSREKSMEAVEDHQMARKIDRLSLLPNELLDHIFDLAYSIDTPSTGALSKHLLPFHNTGIFRRISLEKSINIAKLVRTINSSPSLAGIVQTLHLVCQDESLGAFDTLESTEIERFFRQLVRLEWLDLGEDSYELFDKLKSTSNLISPIPLRHLTSGASPRSEHPLVEFTSFPTLRSLHVTTYADEYNAFDTNGLSTLPLLTHLTVSGTYAESLSIASFCALCPSLTHLTLHCTSPDYPPLLKILPTSLISLELHSRDTYDQETCRGELSRFTHLRHLSIGSFLFSYNLPRYLDTTIALESLEIGEGHVSIDGLIGLLDKLPTLRHLRLDLLNGSVGSRLEVEVGTGYVEAKGIPPAEERLAVDWGIPGFMYTEEYGTTLEAARKLLSRARDAGVRVEGSILEAVRVMNALNLEIANVAIYRCFEYQTFQHYTDLKADNITDRLPPLDLDSLDSNNLKLVKTELPDEGWFALSLEAGEV